MSNSSNFSMTFDVTGAPAIKPPADEPGEELFALAPLSEHHLPDGSVLARNRISGAEMVLPLEVFNAMSYCDRFKTLEEHTDLLMEDNPGAAGRQAAIRSVVQSIRDGGLTISAQEICERLAPQKEALPLAEKPVVVVITWERPANLERLLASLMANCDPEGIHCCYVVDDSRTADNIKKNRAITLDFNDRSALEIEYVGASETREIMDQLIRRLPQHEQQIRFALDRERWASHWTAGITRNYSHLLSVGRPVIVLDDDVLCEVYDSPVSETGVEFSGRQREVQYFGDTEGWREMRAGSDTDPIARHMQCLGLTLPEALGVLGQAQLHQRSLEHASPEMTDGMNRNSRILITQCGSMGDPGTGSNLWLATIGSDSLDRLLQAPEMVQSAMKDRNAWLGRTRPVFETRANISQITGFDNRASLPPYFPIDRGQDRLFGNMVDYIFYDGMTLEYPWAAPHLPVPERKWTQRDNNFSRPPRFPGFFTEHITREKVNCRAADPATRREHLAAMISDLAGSPRRTLVNLMADDWHRIRNSQLAHLGKRLEESSAQHSDWREYLLKAVRETQSVKVENIHKYELRGTIEGLRGEELVSFWRDLWRDFAGALLAWPEIRESAREIVEERSHTHL
jgi:hypothetical protein